jgi:hypothetical protein
MDKLSSYLTKRVAFMTRLTRKGPAPESWEDFQLPENTELVLYQSGTLQLKAYIQFPDQNIREKKPAILFFHGGCALQEAHLRCSRPFLDAGLVVMSPTFRGENGNPGNYELFFGEVDDARAAVIWLSQQSYVDETQMYTFGTSMGGEISALLSLYNDLPLRFGGSCGAFFGRSERFGPESMYNAPVPFDLNDQDEHDLRTLAGNIADMQTVHYAFIGTEDEKFRSKMYKTLDTENSVLQIIEVPGTHVTSLDAAISEFIHIINQGN